jgi:hypothetical protein
MEYASWLLEGGRNLPAGARAAHTSQSAYSAVAGAGNGHLEGYIRPDYGREWKAQHYLNG